MIEMIFCLISLGCTIFTICVNIKILFNGYDLYELPNSDKLLIIPSDATRRITDVKYRVLYNASRKECKAFAKIKGKKIKR